MANSGHSCYQRIIIWFSALWWLLIKWLKVLGIESVKHSSLRKDWGRVRGSWCVVLPLNDLFSWICSWRYGIILMHLWFWFSNDFYNFMVILIILNLPRICIMLLGMCWIFAEGRKTQFSSEMRISREMGTTGNITKYFSDDINFILNAINSYSLILSACLKS